MGIWQDIATWEGPTPNQGGQMVEHRGVVLHIAEGSYRGTVAWCMNPGSNTSAHFVVSKDGEITQLIDTDTQSWCQVEGNSSWISIENEGHGGEALTLPQMQACARILAKTHEVYGIPMQLADSPSGRGLGYHGMGGGSWGGHDQCPGDEIIAQRPTIIQMAGEGTAGTITSSTGDKMGSLMRFSSRPEVFLTDCVTARWVTSESEIHDLRALAAEGTIQLGYGGAIRIVDRRELVGQIVGRVPKGWEDLAA
ncbi:MAG TPA: peptidoglycan recognition family protein [Geobacteraceae bacterium]|nr:peptidoglycan recognition family protein [Geobacteraceae bacterium]